MADTVETITTEVDTAEMDTAEMDTAEVDTAEADSGSRWAEAAPESVSGSKSYAGRNSQPENQSTSGNRGAFFLRVMERSTNCHESCLVRFPFRSPESLMPSVVKR